MRAFTYARLGRPELAMDSATRLYAIQPDTSLVPAGARRCVGCGRPLRRGGPRFHVGSTTSIRTKTAPSPAWATSGSRKARLDAAIAAYRRYQEATPKYGYLCAAQADFGWGRALDAQGKSDEAIAKFEAAAKRDPDNVELWRPWAGVLEQQGKKDEAAAKLDEARKAEARLAVPVKLN